MRVIPLLESARSIDRLCFSSSEQLSICIKIVVESTDKLEIVSFPIFRFLFSQPTIKLRPFSWLTCARFASVCYTNIKIGSLLSFFSIFSLFYVCICECECVPMN